MTEPNDKARPVLVDDKTYNVLSVRNGGMGRVWLLERTFDDSFDPIYRHRIAVKTFDFVEDQQAIERELNIWISLDHPSIVPLKKIGRLNYRLAAIMPLLQGSLDDVLEGKAALSESETARVILDMLEALHYAWTKFNILHLDLKPSNVLVDGASSTRTKIADWGISRLADAQRRSQPLVTKNSVPAAFSQKTAYSAGTPLYMAPERFSGQWTLSPRADVYSIGLMAIHLCTGILPFRFGQVDPAEEIHTGSYFRNACQLLEDRSNAFQEFCLRCIQFNPKARPDTFHGVGDSLMSIIRGASK